LYTADADASGAATALPIGQPGRWDMDTLQVQSFDGYDKDKHRRWPDTYFHGFADDLTSTAIGVLDLGLEA
jgi:hypothetical protein